MFYRIKCSLGENLFLLLVSETFGNIDYDIIIKSVFDFRFKLNDFKKKIEVSEIIKDICSKEMDSKLFKINKCNGDDSADCQNMCGYISKIYGKQIYIYIYIYSVLLTICIFTKHIYR